MPRAMSPCRRSIHHVLVVTLLAALVAVLPWTPAQAAESLTLDKSSDPVLVGENVAYRLTAANDGTVDLYNVTFRDVLPAGVTYVPGSTTPESVGDPSVYTDDDGIQTLIWRNVDDAAQKGDVTIGFKAKPDSDDYPVGSTIPNKADVYANSDPRYVPRFTSAGELRDRSTAEGHDSNTTQVSAIELTKSEPSPEGELLRGVHDHPTVYTLKVRNNGQTPTDGITVVDYLPAGLEFLGCGQVDNSPVGFEEYPGSGRLETPAVGVDCLTPDSVETVNSGLPSGYPAGVYTKVTWSLGDFAGGQTRTIRYAAGIPMRENVMVDEDFVSTANLSNNTGAYTRETETEKAYVNRAIASGDYTGDIDGDPEDKGVESRASVRVTAEDVAAQKAVSPTSFDQGKIATYTLTVRGSEYTTADDIVLRDHLPNGLCPLDARENHAADDPIDECDPVDGADPSGASYASVEDREADGFDIEFTPISLDRSEVQEVVYKARMRGAYRGSHEPTSAGDVFRNTVELDGRTTKLPENETGSDPVTVHDDSSASLTSGAPKLDKQVGVQSTPMTCDDADYTDNHDDDAAELTYRKGDRICFKIRVDFPDSASTRQPRVTDFLPASVDYEAGSTEATGANDLDFEVEDTETGPVFEIGDVIAGKRYAAPGKTFEVTLSGIVNSAGNGDVDVAGNLAKFRWYDQSGRTRSLRDQVDFYIAPPPTVALEKSVDDESVRHGDVSHFVIEVRNDSDTDGITGNERDVSNVQVRDVLPSPFSCDDLDDISDGGACTTTGGVSTVAWTVAGPLASGASTSVSYDATIPDTTSVGTRYENVAGVRSFEAATNLDDDSTTTHYPTDNIDPTVDEDLEDSPAARDTAVVRLPAVELEKSNVTSITTDTGNGLHDAVPGETITYTIRATVPAKTRVYNGVLADTLPADLTFVSASFLTAVDPLPTGYEFDEDTGTLEFPSSYLNDTTSDQVFEVAIVARVTPGSTATGVRTNTARFDSRTTENGSTPVARVEDTSDVTLKMPTAGLTKTASPANPIAAGANVTYTLTASNTGTVPMHDSVITDCLPIGLEYQSIEAPATATAAPATAAQCGTTNFTYITIELGTIEPGANTQVKYTAKLSAEAAGGGTYTNTAKVTGSTIADGDNDNTDETQVSASASRQITTQTASLAKSVTSTTPTIGDTVTYTVKATFGPNVNYYDAAVTDLLPTGLTASSLSDVTVSCARTGGTPATCSDTFTQLTASGQTVGWGLGDLAPDTVSRVYTITYKVKVADIPSNSLGTTRQNTANVRWNSVNKPDPTTVASSNWDKSGTQARSTITIQEPSTTIAKQADRTTVGPGQTVTYTVTASNTGRANVSDAYNVVVRDVVPEGLVVDVETISDGGSYDMSTRTISWNVGTLTKGAPGNSVTRTYQASLAPSGTIDSSPLANRAWIDSYTSRPSGGRTYPSVGPVTATVTPQFPKVAIAKSVLDGATAYIDENKTFTIVATNNGGATASSIDVDDVLPKGWVYGGTATVKIGSGATNPMPPALSGSNPVTLRWAALGSVAPGESVTITYTAKPTSSAITDPGTGRSVDHTNTAKVQARDATGADGNKTGSYAGPDSEATAHVDRADLTIDKKGDGDLVAGRPYAWKLTVGNDGPDTAVGPIVVTDELPSQLTGYSASGTGWTCTVGATSVTCTHAGPVAKDDTLPVITVRGQVPSGLAPSTTVKNTATVEGRTYEADDDKENNSDTETVSVKTLADLAIDKKLVGSVAAGQDATWTLDVTNLGPSTSRGPIKVTDTLPSGTTFVSATGADWDCDEADGEVTCTYAGDLTLGSSAPQIAVKVKVPADRKTAVTNTAEVEGTTPEPDTDEAKDNNDDQVSTPPSRNAVLSLSKAVKGDEELIAGSTGTYVLGVANAGPSTATGVKITDPLPAGLSYEGFSGTGWSCSESSGTVTCTLSSEIVVGGSASVEIEVSVDPSWTAAITNTAKVVATEDPDGDDATDTNTPDQDSDYTVDKSHTGDATAGEQLEYTIEVTNHGPSDSPGPLTVRDRLPAGVTYASASGGGWTCTAGTADASGQTVDCTRTGSLADDASTSFTMTVDVAADAGPATLVNSVAVSGPNETKVDNNTDTDPTKIVDDANVTISKTASADTVHAGDPISWTIGVANEGPSNADAVTVSDTVPAGLTITSVSGGSTWDCPFSAGSFTCSRSTLAPGPAPSITVVTRVGSGVQDGTTLTNTARVSTSTAGDDPDDNDGRDSADVTTDADLGITKKHQGTPVAGRPFDFTIGVTNHGPSDAQGPITVTDTLPEGMTYVSVAAGWTCTPGPVSASGQEVGCTWTSDEPLVADESTPDLVMTVDIAPDTAGEDLENSATVDAATDDSDPTNDEATDEVTPTGSADVSVTKSHTGAVRVGDEMTFTLDVHNDGPSEARDVTVTDRLPSGLTFVSADGDGWTCEDDEPVCVLDDPLAAGADAEPITVTVLVEPAAYPNVDNVAEVSTSTPDPEDENDESTDPVTVPPQVDLEVVKDLVGDRLKVGEQSVYTLTVTNHGPTADPGPVTVTDVLPEGLAFVSADGDDWMCTEDDGTVTCLDANGLDVDETTVIELTVDVLPAAYPSIENTAQVESPAEDLDPDNNISPVTRPVRGSSLMTIDKSLSERKGRDAVWKLTVTNEGPTETTEPVVVTDQLPKGLVYRSASGDGWSCTGHDKVVSCDYASVLAVGESATITVRTHITARAGSTVTNVATVTAGDDSTGSSDDADVKLPAKPGGGWLPGTGGPEGWLLLLALLAIAAGTFAVRRRDH